MLTRFFTHSRLIDDETGQTMSEYAVTLGVIVLGVIVAIGVLATAASGNFTNAATRIASIVP